MNSKPRPGREEHDTPKPRRRSQGVLDRHGAAERVAEHPVLALDLARHEVVEKGVHFRHARERGAGGARTAREADRVAIAVFERIEQRVVYAVVVGRTVNRDQRWGPALLVPKSDLSPLRPPYQSEASSLALATAID